MFFILNFRRGGDKTRIIFSFLQGRANVPKTFIWYKLAILYLFLVEQKISIKKQSNIIVV
jgi:hypothetical protein